MKVKLRETPLVNYEFFVFIDEKLNYAKSIQN